MSGVVILGSGFVGATIARAVGADREIRVLDIPTHPVLADRDEAGVRLIRDEIERVGATAVVNTAGRIRGTDDEMHAANVAWPAWLTNVVLAGSDVRFVHVGSAAEYGDPGSADPIPESGPTVPSGVYGETKLAGSLAVLDTRRAGLDAVVARVFNLVASPLPVVSPLHQFLTDVTALPPEGGVVELWWPETARDFILLDDLAAAVAALAMLDDVPEIVNVCSGTAVTFAAIVTAIAARQGKRVEIRSLERPGIPAVIGDASLLGSLTGVRPQMSAELVAEHIDP